MKFGPVTLLRHGKFVLPNGSTCEIGGALQRLQVDGVTLSSDPAKNQLCIEVQTGALLIAKYDRDADTWSDLVNSDSADLRSSESPGSARPATPQGAQDWPQLASFKDEDATSYYCVEPLHYSGQIAVPASVPMSRYAQHIVKEILRCQIPGDLGWSEHRGHTDSCFGIVLVRPFRGDTFIKSYIECSKVGEIYSASLTTEVVVWPHYLGNRMAERFDARLLPFLLWLLAGLTTVVLSKFKPPNIPNWFLLAGAILIAGLVLRWILRRYIALDYPGASWSRAQKKNLHSERMTWPAFWFCMPSVLSLVCGLAYQSVPMSTLFVGPYRLATLDVCICLVFLPSAIPMLSHICERTFFPIKGPSWDVPQDGEFKATHQALLRIVAGESGILAE